MQLTEIIKRIIINKSISGGCNYTKVNFFQIIKCEKTYNKENKYFFLKYYNIIIL